MNSFLQSFQHPQATAAHPRSRVHHHEGRPGLGRRGVCLPHQEVGPPPGRGPLLPGQVEGTERGDVRFQYVCVMSGMPAGSRFKRDT